MRKTFSHSKKKAYLQRHIDLEDAIYNFVRPHSALKISSVTPLLMVVAGNNAPLPWLWDSPTTSGVWKNC